MWLDSLRRLVESRQRKRGSRSRPAMTRGHRRPAALGLERLEDRMVLSTLTVMNLNDSASFKPGDGSLRGEIAAAQAGDTIQFAAGLGGTINLTAGELLINKNLTILGSTTAGAPNITINNASLSRVFDIEGGTSGVNVTFQNLTVQGGTAAEGGGLFIYDPAGTVTLNNLNITGNRAVGAAGTNGAPPGKNTPANAGTPGQDALGGGVFFAGGPSATLVISNSTLQGNRVNGGTGGRGGYGGRDFNGAGSGTGVGGNGGAGGVAKGGALYVSGGNVQLTNDTIKNNALVSGQGGIGSDGGVTAGNHNAEGGQGGAGGLAAGAGLYVSSGIVQLNGDTITGNTALGGRGGVGGSGGNVEPSGPARTGASGNGGGGEGGGVFVNAGSVQVSTSTIQGNDATGGSNPNSNANTHTGGNGIGGGLFVQGGSLLVLRSTVAGNAANGGGATNAPGGAYGGAAAVTGGDALFFDDTIALNGTTPGGSNANTLGASLGGALAVLGGDLRLTNDTIANNTANGGTALNGTAGISAFGGALANLNGTVEMANTILAFNNAQNVFGLSAELYGTINSSNHDLIDNASDIFGVYTPGVGDQLGVSPNIAPLGNYGGPTQTMPLLPGSPAIDAGANTFQGPATTAGLIGWWRGEGSAADSAGTNNGTATSTVGYLPGLSGQAFNFNGQGSYVDLGTGPDIVGTGAFTIGVWIRTTSDGMIINQRDPANFNGEYALQVQNGKINWSTFGNNQSGFNFSSVQSVNDGNWHFITVTRLANGMGQIYIDGHLDSAQAAAPVPLGSGFHVYIGEDVRNAVDIGPGYSNNFIGQIDEVQIYNQALTLGQIQALAVPSYTATGLGTVGAWPTDVNGLVSWLPGEGNFVDAAGSNPGTPTGGVRFTPGQVGQAFQLNGSTGKISLADNPSLDPASFTVGGWFQLTQPPAAGSTAYLVSKFDGNLRGWTLGVNSSLVPTFSISTVGNGSGSVNGPPSYGTANATATTPLTLNKWYYLSATFDGTTGTATLYVNGIATATATLPTAAYSPSTTPLVIGSASWTNGGYFAGKVDEFAFYNHALPPAEVGLLSTAITTDQRGGARTVGSHVDIGATEYQYDVALTGSASPTVTPGGMITYTLTLSNKGLDTATNVTGTIQLPTGVTLSSLVSPPNLALGGAFQSSTASFTYIGGLAPGASVTFSVGGLVPSTTPAGTVLTGTASVSPTADDSNPANNTLSLTTTVVSAITQPGDAGFELPSVGTGAFGDYRYDPTGTAWTFSAQSGVAGNGSGFTAGNPPAPQGTQVGFLQETGTISQAVNFSAGTYTINFAAAQRGNVSHGGQTFAVELDGKVIGTFTPAGTSYAAYTTNAFTVAAGSHTISFVGLDPKGGDNTALIDNISIQAAPTGVDIHGQPHDAQAGQPIGPVVVAVVDDNGNTVPGSDIPVTLAIYSGPDGSVLEGSTTVRAVNGVATFTDLRLNVAGTYVLKATSGKLDPDYSNAFTISPTDVSDDVKVHRDPLHKVHGETDLFEQKVTITNIGKGALDGPLALVLTDLPSGVTLQGESGTYQGDPYVDILDGKDALAPGQKVTVTLTFLVTGLHDPDDISYSTETLQGI